MINCTNILINSLINNNKRESMYSDNYLKEQKQYTHNVPVSKESLYFRDMFELFFGKGLDHIIPYYWLPKWCGRILEPSATVLDVYKDREKDKSKSVSLEK